MTFLLDLIAERVVSDQHEIAILVCRHRTALRQDVLEVKESRKKIRGLKIVSDTNHNNNQVLFSN
jgi:hypothetical protein